MVSNKATLENINKKVRKLQKEKKKYKCRFCKEEYFNVWMHIKRKHLSELEDEKHKKKLENDDFPNDLGNYEDNSNDEYQNETENIDQEYNEDSKKEDFNSDNQSDIEEKCYIDIENKDNDESVDKDNNLEISFEEVKSYEGIKQYFITNNLFKSIDNCNQINDYCLFYFRKYLDNDLILIILEDLNKSSLEKILVKYKYPIDPNKYEVEVNNKQGIPFKKTISYNNILECIVSLIKIPHIRNNLKLETILLNTNDEENIKFNKIDIGIFSDSYSKGKAASTCIKNDHEVKLTDQVNFQKVLDIIFKDLVDFLNSDYYFIVDNEKYVINLYKIYGDLPGLSLFLNIAFFSKQIDGCHSCLAPSEKMNYIDTRHEKKSKNYAKELISSLPIINGVNLRAFDLKFFVGKEYRILLEIFSIIISEITQAVPSSNFLKSYLHVVFLHEEYLKLLLCSNEYFTTEKEKTDAMYIKDLIFEHRKEYLKIRKNILEKRYRRRCKRNKVTLDLNSLDKFKEKGLMILHLGIHYIEDLEMNKNPINHTGQDMEASIRDYKRIETTKSNNKYGYSIMKCSNLRVLNRINSKIKKINNQEKEDISKIDKIKKKIKSERNDIEDFDISIVYTSGNYISLDYEFSNGPNKIKSINYSIINEIVEIKYSEKKEVLFLVDFSWINEFHTNIFRVIYDIDINKTIENSSIVSLYSLNNLVYRWEINKKIYGSAFTIIDLYRPKIFTFSNSDPSQSITVSKLNNLKKAFSNKRNIKKKTNDETVLNNSINSTAMKNPHLKLI
ncbi:hypothetical protein ACTFIR_009767 [Dictyostelium discoideum]